MRSSVHARLEAGLGTKQLELEHQGLQGNVPTNSYPEADEIKL